MGIVGGGASTIFRSSPLLKPDSDTKTGRTGVRGPSYHPPQLAEPRERGAQSCRCGSGGGARAPGETLQRPLGVRGTQGALGPVSVRPTVCFLLLSSCPAGLGCHQSPGSGGKLEEGRGRSPEEGCGGGECTKLGSSGNCVGWGEEIRGRLGGEGGVEGV